MTDMPPPPGPSVPPPWRPQHAGHGAPGPGRPAVPLGERLGPRLLSRPQPRLGISLAAAGAALVLTGVLVWSIGYLVDGLRFRFDDSGGGPSFSGENRKYFGALLSAVVVAAGYALLVLRRRGPLATAGAVASAFGIPLVVTFLTVDVGGLISGDALDPIYLISILAWLVSYFFVPGARGRGFYVGLIATGFASYVGLKAASPASLVRVGISTTQGGSGSSSGTDSVIAIGLIFGLAYYGLALLLDRRGRHGASVGLVYAGFVTTVTGVIAALPSFGQAGTGFLLIALGLALAWYGARFDRRFTTWAWTGAFVLGVLLLAEKVLPNSYAAAAVLLIAVGAAVVAVAAVVGRQEAPDVLEQPAVS